MRPLLLAMAAACLAAACRSPSPPPSREDPASPSSEPLIDIRDVDAGILVDIRYATDDNFTGKALYPAGRCLLRRSVAERLRSVRSDLAAVGLGLKVWDCYRPLAIQRELWALVPDPRYVADPEKGSRHNRGAAVDLTLVDAQGRELEMPTGYDDFTPKAHRDYAQGSPEALRNRTALERAMSKRGFIGLRTEWWHFDAPGWRGYPLTDVPLERP
ncbi:MAG: D-alanyl-D-alanine dipeptidase [Elusimicrobiota bacterium]